VWSRTSYREALQAQINEIQALRKANFQEKHPSCPPNTTEELQHLEETGPEVQDLIAKGVNPSYDEMMSPDMPRYKIEFNFIILSFVLIQTHPKAATSNNV
jgi:hypothetical protein